MTVDDAPKPTLLEYLLRAAATVVVIAAAALFAIVEAFMVPFRIGGFYIPIAAVLAVVTNLALPSLALWLSQLRSVALLPGLVWFVVVITSSMPTSEGDLVIHDIWPGMTLLLAGAVSVAIGGFRVVSGIRAPEAAKS